MNRTVSQNSRVIVVGAGVAGLNAAAYLKKKGIDVLVIEASNKIGGRLKTDRKSGIAFDEGASWIHSPKGNPISKLIKVAGLETYLTDDQSVQVYDTDGSQYSADLLDRTEAKYNKALKRLSGNLNESFESVFFRKYPQRSNSRLWRYMLSAFLEFDSGADLADLSSLDFYDDEEFKGEDIIVTNGFDSLANYLGKNIDIRLDSRVSSIDYSQPQISVQSNTGIEHADAVLVTVPLGVLKNRDISFSPSLPRKVQQSITDIKMGSVNKFLCLWDETFWDPELQYIGFTPNKRGKFNYFLNMKPFTDANALMTFTYGDYSVSTEKMTDEDVIDAIMAHLRTIYGSDIPAPKQMLRTKWNSDKNTYGSYSYVANGVRSKAFAVFKQPIDNKLYFAGEHTSRKYRSTVHGAYLSGRRAAKKIASALQA
ncbi:MAG: flavin monoamine oxidase family protein [Pseudomonadales bacterium]